MLQVSRAMRSQWSPLGRSSLQLRSAFIRRCSSHVHNAQSQGRLSKTWKTMRESPNTKFWVLGLSAAAGTTYYFVEKDRKNKQIVATVLPPGLSHYCHPRQRDVDQLFEAHEKLKKQNKVVEIHITGSSGAGKTQLSRLFAEELSKRQKEQFHPLSSNEIVGTLRGDSPDSYLLSLKGLLLALKCSNSEWMEKLTPGKKIQHQDMDTQIKILMEVLQEKLRNSSGWILVIDNVHNSNDWLKDWLPGQEGDWGKGTLVVSSQVPAADNAESVYEHKMQSLTNAEAVELLTQVSGLPEDVTEGLSQTAERLQGSPLALVAAGTYMNIKLKSSSDLTFKEFLQSFERASEKFQSANPESHTALKELEPSIIATAMATKALIESNLHLLHGFDFLACCPEQTPVPMSLLRYHLRRKEFRLPIAQYKSNDLLSLLPTKSDMTSGDSLISLDEQKAKIWSFKGMAEKILETKDQIVELYKEVKKAFGYGDPFTLPELDDGMGMVRNCNLLNINKEKPGDIECILVHPVTHLVFQQVHMAVTAPFMEDQFLKQAEDMHNRSSWFQRLKSFDPQTKLQEYRNGLGEKDVGKTTNKQAVEAAVVKIPEFIGYDVTGILQDDANRHLEEYRQLSREHLFKHIQEHWKRLVGSITAECTSAGADVKSLAAQKFIVPITTCILASHLPEELGTNTSAQALIGLASVYCNVYDNTAASRDFLEHALSLQEPKYGKDSMEVAEIYTHLAITHNSLDNVQYSKELLESAMEIYEKHRKKFGEHKQPVAYARTLAALGVVVGTLGDKERSKSLLEKAIGVHQSAQPNGQDEAENKKFAMAIASNLTDLGHAYLSLGQVFQGWKVLELSLQGHKNLHGDQHPEVVRALNVLSIAKLMQGNDTESRKLRREAGRIEKKLAAAPSL